MLTFPLVGMLALLLVGLPVAFALMLAGMGGFVSMTGTTGLQIIPKLMYDSMQSFILTAVPMFMIMGKFLAEGGIGTRMYDFAQVWLRHLPGGLAVGTIASCAFMGAVAGSSTAIVAAVGTVAIPELLRRGYSQQSAMGAVAAGATLGILIPPSIPLLIFSAITDESAGKLFAAGIVPGILLATSMAIYAGWAAWRQGVAMLPKATWAERRTATRRAIWALLLPVVVLGSIYTGIATPTEAAALGAVASMFVAVVIYREVKLRQLPRVLLSAMVSSVMIMFIVQGALIFGKYATMAQIPQEIVEWIGHLNLSAFAFVIACSILFLILGCFLEVVSILLITLPILVVSLGVLQIDLTWFAIVMMINMELALITPPIGINLFVVGGMMQNIGQPAPQSRIVAGVMPYFWIMIVFMIALIVFPPIVTVPVGWFFQ